MLKINVFVAAIALLNCCPANGRIYRTRDTTIFEIDRSWDGSFYAKQYPLSQSDFLPIESFLTDGLIPQSDIPMFDPLPAMSVDYTDPQSAQYQGSDFYSWFHYIVTYVGARLVPASIYEFRQQNIPCGIGPNLGRIFNGQEAVPSSWPFVVAVMETDSGVIEFSGSLISPTKILTAASYLSKLSMFDLSKMVVKLGVHNIGNKTNVGDAGMTRRISRMAINNAYNTKTRYYDVAVITMDAAVTYSRDISPVCLPPASTNVSVYTDATAYIMGWGNTVENSTAEGNTTKLIQAATRTMTNANCKNIYKKPDQIADHMLCASDIESAGCYGDNGGPLVVRSDAGFWTQAGILSWGTDCTLGTTHAGVYTKVPFLRSWIDTNMRN